MLLQIFRNIETLLTTEQQ